MKLHIAGGVGEHGRNCFFIEGTQASFIVDCGVMVGSEKPYPNLTDSQIHAARFLFITHSHLDHTGAFTWLVERGFFGCVVMTRETAGQLPFKPERVCIIDDTAPAMSDAKLTDRLTVQWGRSGHCAGSVWYAIKQDEKTMLFSGDYVEDTLVYRCNPIIGIHAEMAVLDSAYGDSNITPEDYRNALLNYTERLVRKGKRILFPVPKYGRGFELLLLLHTHFPETKISLDHHFQGELTRINSLVDWLKSESLFVLQRILSNRNTNREQSTFVLVSDSQLNSLEGQEIAAYMISTGQKIILTGNADIGSFSEKLLLSGSATFLRYAVHTSFPEMKMIEKKNTFAEVIAFHSERLHEKS